MARVHRTRIIRLEAPDAPADPAECLDRSALDARIAICATIRERLAQVGIDPAGVPALQRAPAPEPGAASSLHRDTPSPSLTLPRKRGRGGWGQSGPPEGLGEDGASEKVEEFPASDDDALASEFAEKIGDMVRLYEDGHKPDFANASLAELFAWCLAQPPQTSPQTSDDPA